jgi:hypothetical protein
MAMKSLWIYLVFVVVVLSCQQKAKTAIAVEPSKYETFIGKKSPSDIALIADHVVDTLKLNNGDTVFVLKSPVIKDDIGDKRPEYPIYLKFSNKEWPVLLYKNAIGAEIYILNDLDGDLVPEVLLRPTWFSSCWASINLFSLKNKKWKLIKKGSMYFCSDKYPLNKRIVKTEKGWGLLTDSLAEDRFITLKKEIRF